MKATKVLLVLCIISVVLTSCGGGINLVESNGTEFVALNQVKLIQRAQDRDSLTVIGAVADVHGDTNKAAAIAREFRKNNVEYVVILGDANMNEPLRYGTENTVPDVQELTSIWREFASLGIPVFVMPGNHEGNTAYQEALSQVPEVIDLVQYRIIDADDVAFFAVPGYHDTNFLPEDGYFYSERDLQFIPEVVPGVRGTPILISHGPPQGKDETGIDYVPNIGNVGDAQLNDILEKSQIRYSLSGHIHEAGHQAMNSEQEAIDLTGTLEEAYVNIGAGEEGKAMVVILSGRNIQLKPITVE